MIETNTNKLHIYTVHFTGREAGAIGIFYSISDVFYAKDDSDFSRQFWEKYELGTITRTNRFWFDVTKNGVEHHLDKNVFAQTLI